MTYIGNHEIDDPSVLRAFSYRLIFNRRELVFGGEGGGEMGGDVFQAPVFKHLF